MNAIELILVQTQDRLKSQLDERLEAVDTFFEGFSMEDEESEALDSRQVTEELASISRTSLKLSSDHQKALRDRNGHGDLDEVIDEVHAQVETQLVNQAITRLVGAVERRMEESLDVTANELSEREWDEIEDLIIAAIEALYDRRRERLLGEGGQIARDLEQALAKTDASLGANAI